jgi:hypothetical protein
MWLISNDNLASEKCQQEKRKRVNEEDILFATTVLSWELEQLFAEKAVGFRSILKT